MIGKVVSHYSVLWNPACRRNPRKRDKILEKLGEGGMGVVYKAEDTKLTRTVALKFLTPALLAAEDDRRRFVHEAQTSASLNHPSIATVHEINDRESTPFIVLEYVEGVSLADRVKSGPL